MPNLGHNYRDGHGSGDGDAVEAVGRGQCDISALHEDGIDHVDVAIGAVQVGADQLGLDVLPQDEGGVSCKK